MRHCANSPGSSPSPLDELPHAPGHLLDAPDTIRQALYAALGIQCVYRAGKHQATTSDTTPGIVAALIASPRTVSDTGPAPDPFATLANGSRAASAKFPNPQPTRRLNIEATMDL
jgi:hypothetical protein